MKKKYTLFAEAVSGLRRNTVNYRMLYSILRYGYVYTGYYTGSGRYTHAVDNTSSICNYLKHLGISYKCGNDSPRGGVGGNYLQVTSPGFLKELKKMVSVYEAEEKKKKEEKEAKIKAEEIRRRQEQSMIMKEASKINLADYRDEIKVILDEHKEFWDSWRGRIRKSHRVEVVQFLMKDNPGINPEAMRIALGNFKGVD